MKKVGVFLAAVVLMLALSWVVSNLNGKSATIAVANEGCQRR